MKPVGPTTTTRPHNGNKPPSLKAFLMQRGIKVEGMPINHLSGLPFHPQLRGFLGEAQKFIIPKNLPITNLEEILAAKGLPDIVCKNSEVRIELQTLSEVAVENKLPVYGEELPDAYVSKEVLKILVESQGIIMGSGPFLMEQLASARTVKTKLVNGFLYLGSPNVEGIAFGALKTEKPSAAGFLRDLHLIYRSGQYLNRGDQIQKLIEDNFELVAAALDYPPAQRITDPVLLEKFLNDPEFQKRHTRCPFPKELASYFDLISKLGMKDFALKLIKRLYQNHDAEEAENAVEFFATSFGAYDFNLAAGRYFAKEEQYEIALDHYEAAEKLGAANERGVKSAKKSSKGRPGVKKTQKTQKGFKAEEKTLKRRLAQERAELYRKIKEHFNEQWQKVSGDKELEEGETLEGIASELPILRDIDEHLLLLSELDKKVEAGKTLVNYHAILALAAVEKNSGAGKFYKGLAEEFVCRILDRICRFNFAAHQVDPVIEKIFGEDEFVVPDIMEEIAKKAPRNKSALFIIKKLSLDHFETAARAFQEKDYELGIAEAQKALEARPRHFEAKGNLVSGLMEYAFKLVSEKESSKAKPLFEEALKLVKELRSMRDYNKANPIFKQQFDNFVRRSTARLATIYYNEGDYARTAEVAEQLLRDHGSSFEVLKVKGLAYYNSYALTLFAGAPNQEFAEKSIKAFKDALNFFKYLSADELKPVKFSLVLMLFLSGRLKEGMATARTMFEADENGLSLKQMVQLTIFALKWPEPAMIDENKEDMQSFLEEIASKLFISLSRDLEQARKVAPEISNELAFHAYQKGFDEFAEELYSFFFENYGSQDEIYWMAKLNRATVLAKLEKYKEAKKIFEDFINKAPACEIEIFNAEEGRSHDLRLEAFRTLAFIYILIAEKEKAKRPRLIKKAHAVLDDAIKEYPNWSIFYRIKATAFEKQKNRKMALIFYKKAFEKNPDAMEAYLGYYELAPSVAILETMLERVRFLFSSGDFDSLERFRDPELLNYLNELFSKEEARHPRLAEIIKLLKDDFPAAHAAAIERLK